MGGNIDFCWKILHSFFSEICLQDLDGQKAFKSFDSHDPSTINCQSYLLVSTPPSLSFCPRNLANCRFFTRSRERDELHALHGNGADEVSCYIKDDGASVLLFDALSETDEFARRWVPFCRRSSIKSRAPEG
ncbi:hypothetical protein POM88_007783 [Heracleum sosnowskyi]|uniref:Uncharacterized protein n=1 Tax=Heracleum sosnowskyi TaxID=360622 RepID=A0AAD8N157_9APIA|nr:hypothetical protein POM88_007783 [Heracleum sosnowskyi]